MNSEQLKREFQDLQKIVQSIVKDLGEISRLNQNPERSPTKVKQVILRLTDRANKLKGDASVQKLINWLDQYESELGKEADEIRKKFGTRLEEELRKIGLSLSGQYPELKAGLFTIELDFDQWKAMLWYGPKQERLGECPLSVREIISLIQEKRTKLGSQLPEKELHEKLREAYHRAVERKHGEPAPIIKVLAEMSFLMQSSRFTQDPKKENYTSYSRADFSYDIFRMRRFQTNSLFPTHMRLTTATRAHTKKRSDFLWIPDDENGRGTTYSHLKFEEEKK